MNNSAGMKSMRKGKVEIRLDRCNGAKSYKAQECRWDFIEKGSIIKVLMQKRYAVISIVLQGYKSGSNLLGDIGREKLSQGHQFKDLW